MTFTQCLPTKYQADSTDVLPLGHHHSPKMLLICYLRKKNLCMCVCLVVCIEHHIPTGAHGGQKRPHSLELEL